jgi:MraZ protein
MRFIGNIEAKVDAKSRVFIPAHFRRILQTEGQLTLYLRKDIFEKCIVIYPESVWEQELARLRSRLNKWIPEQQDIYRQFMLEAVMVELDASGRILVPKSLLGLCGIGTDVRFLGVDDTIEIWDKSELETPRMAPDDFKRQIASIMGGVAEND